MILTPHKPTKQSELKIETHISGYRGITLSLFEFSIYLGKHTCRVKRDTTINRFQPEDWPQKFLMQLLKNLCVATAVVAAVVSVIADK